jgi:hypothetical protein
MVKGIKRCKIYRCLDFAVYDDVLFWASWPILVSCDHPSLLYLMALPVLHRFTYPIMMLPLTEESIRLVFKCLSKCLKPIPFRLSARVHSGSGSFSLVSGRIATQLLGDLGRCRRPSVRPFQWCPPPDTYSFYRASSPTAEPGWYNWSFWQS